MYWVKRNKINLICYIKTISFDLRINSDLPYRIPVRLLAKFRFICEIQAWHTVSGFVVYIKRHLPSMSFYESHRRQPSITPARRETLDFIRKSRDSP